MGSLLMKGNRLSDLVIDVDKDWNDKYIRNTGAPFTDKGAITRGLKGIYSPDFAWNWTDLGVIASGAIWVMTYLGNGIVTIGDANGRIYRSTDYGLTWANLGVICTNDIFSMVNLGSGIAILGDDDGHIFRSIDYGANWLDLGVIAANGIFCLGYLGNGIALAAARNGHVHQSTNYGAAWIDLGVVANGGISWWYTIPYLGNGITLLGDDAGHIYRSTNYGADWTDLGAIATSWVNGMQYIGNGIVNMAAHDQKTYRSTDYGLTWAYRVTWPVQGSASVLLDDGVACFGLWNHTHFRKTTDYWDVTSAVVTGGFNGYSMAYLGNGITLLADGAHIWRSTTAFHIWER